MCRYTVSIRPTTTCHATDLTNFVNRPALATKPKNNSCKPEIPKHTDNSGSSATDSAFPTRANRRTEGDGVPSHLSRFDIYLY